MSNILNSKYKLAYVGTLIQQIRGVSYSAEETSETFRDGMVPILRANNIGDKINFDKLIFVKKARVKDNQYLKKGDILIATSSGSKNMVGKAVQISGDMKYSFGAFCKVLRPNSNIDANYLGFFFLSSYYRQTISYLSEGVSINNIRSEHIDKLQMPLPPLETQRKIAAVLDKAQELIDKRKQQIALLDELIKSVFIDMFGDPEKNNLKLSTIKLGDIGYWQSGGTPSRKNEDYFKGDIPWLTSGELGSMYINDSLERITEDAIQNTSAKIVDVGSLLLGMYDTAALKSSINTVVCSCNQAIAFSHLDKELVNTIYVYHAIQIGRDYFKRLQRGVRQKNLNLSMIRSIEILYPPKDFQDKFAEIADTIELQKYKMQQSLTEMEHFFNSLMQHAFKGELF